MKVWEARKNDGLSLRPGRSGTEPLPGADHQIRAPQHRLNTQRHDRLTDYRRRSAGNGPSRRTNTFRKG